MYRLRRTALLASETPRLLSPAKAIPEISHLPISIRHSFSNVIANRRADKKIRQKYFSDKLVVLITLPNLDTTVPKAYISHILPISENEPAIIPEMKQSSELNHYPGYMLFNSDVDLRPEIVHEFRQGGVVDSHASATGKNLRVLDLLDIRYIVILRHPADQLVAALYKYLYSSVAPDINDSKTLILDTVSPLNKDSFNCNLSMSDNLRYLISGGYLGSVLSWMSDWLQFRDSERCLVIKQEDLATDRIDCLNKISQFLSGTNSDEKNSSWWSYLTEQRNEEIKRCETVGEHETENILWCSDENIGAYEKVVEEFMKLQPNGKSLLEFYPNLARVSI